MLTLKNYGALLDNLGSNKQLKKPEIFKKSNSTAIDFVKIKFNKREVRRVKSNFIGNVCSIDTGSIFVPNFSDLRENNHLKREEEKEKKVNTVSVRKVDLLDKLDESGDCQNDG